MKKSDIYNNVSHIFLAIVLIVLLVVLFDVGGDKSTLIIIQVSALFLQVCCSYTAFKLRVRGE